MQHLPAVLAYLLALSWAGQEYFFFLLRVTTRKSFKTLTIKQGKHNTIMLLAQGKLDTMANIISQAIQGGNISPTEFHRALQEVQKYRKLKADIENLAEAKIKQIMEKQREESLEQGRKEGVEDFLRKITNTSGTQGVSAIENMNLPTIQHVILWSIKDYKINLVIFPICRISLGIQHLACLLINHRVTIHRDIFLKFFPCEFPYPIIH